MLYNMPIRTTFTGSNNKLKIKTVTKRTFLNMVLENVEDTNKRGCDRLTSDSINRGN